MPESAHLTPPPAPPKVLYFLPVLRIRGPGRGRACNHTRRGCQSSKLVAWRGRGALTNKTALRHLARFAGSDSLPGPWSARDFMEIRGE